jgi:hypothetical protein
MPVLEDVADGADADPTRGSGHSAMCERAFVARVIARPKPRGGRDPPCADPLWGKRRGVDNSETADQNHRERRRYMYPTHRLTNDSRTKTEPRNATG